MIMEFMDELRFLKEQLKFNEKVDVPPGASEVVIAGMGGSGIAGKIFQELFTEFKVHLVDNYAVPKFVSKSTLFIAISFSGNTEETISAASQAARAGAHMVTISSGGALSEMGDQNIKIPRNDIQPRSATGYMLIPLLKGFDVISKSEINESYGLLDQLDKNNEECKIHAKNISKKSLIPVIYGSPPLCSIAYRWKTQFNENAKVIAYSNSFPELNHNDTMAIAQTYRKDEFYFLVFGSDSGKIKKRINVTEKITESNFNVIKPKGHGQIPRMFYMLHYGDYVSYHLGMLRKVNPTDISLIEKLKKEIK